MIISKVTRLYTLGTRTLFEYFVDSRLKMEKTQPVGEAEGHSQISKSEIIIKEVVSFGRIRARVHGDLPFG